MTKTTSAKIIGIRNFFALLLFKIKDTIPNTDKIDKKNIPINDKEQLNMNIELLIFSEIMDEPSAGIHTETLLPAKNCNAPNIPPLCKSDPVIPILVNNDDPEVNVTLKLAIIFKSN